MDGAWDGVALHRLLFPVGARQAANLAGLADGPPEATFLAWHRGIASALATLAARAGGQGGLADWLLLRDEPPASALLWDGEPAGEALPWDGEPAGEALPWDGDQLGEATRRGRDAFLDEAAGWPDRGSPDLGECYRRVVAPDLRHRLGEHYTPHWLVDRIVAHVPPGAVTADPACGDGRFLAALLARGHDPALLWGADLNPLAVVMARLTVWVAAGRPAQPPVRIDWADFLLDPDTAPPELTGAVRNAARLPAPSWFVGNPPWVTWRNLSDGYRSAVAAAMAGTRLHHTRGWAARVSAGQADLAHLFVHQAVERVAPGGQLAFVLPRTTFKAPVGPARLREGIATSGRRYRFREVWDCLDTEPFTGVRADAVVGFVEADRPHTFPVRWVQLRRDGTGRRLAATLSDPADPASPWLTDEPPLRLAGSGQRWTELRARGGINTGGGNAAFHLTVVDTAAGIATVRTRDGVTARVETACLRPLLRGRDVAAWRAVPGGHLLLPHDPADLRRPLAETDLARTAPLAYQFLLGFKDLLAARKERKRWGTEAWYALFRIGPYTAGCWRVVWPHSAGGRLRAAVLAPGDPTVPDQKVVLVPFDASEPAHFLCALLNSPVVRRTAAASAGLDASPNLVRRLPLPRYDGADGTHRRIVALARRAADDEPARRQVADLTGGLFVDREQESRDTMPVDRAPLVPPTGPPAPAGGRT